MPKRMPSRTLAAALLSLTATAVAQPRSSSVPPGYELLWADEFNAAALDRDAWLHRTTRRGNVSVCRPENVVVTGGQLRIDLKRERFDGVPLTCGGVITRQKYKYGYFEVSAKLDGGAGWHEAFWTTATTDFDLSEQERARPRIEIDVFEHYAAHDPSKFTYGVIEWHPQKGSVCREVVDTEFDLSTDYFVYGFEFTPDFIAFYFNGEMLNVFDVRTVAHNLHHAWLSCIGTTCSDATTAGACYFDYFRVYTIDFQSEQYERRRWEFVQKLAAAGPDAAPASAGLDLWIEAERFARPGGWSVERDGQNKILVGHKKRVANLPWDRRAATTMVKIPAAGEYRLWVRARDYAENAPGRRRFQIAVNGRQADATFGAHQTEGYAWENGGVFKLPAGAATIELIDSSQFFARCDRILLTTDLEYQPPGCGGRENVQHAYDQAELKTARPR